MMMMMMPVVDSFQFCFIDSEFEILFAIRNWNSSLLMLGAQDERRRKGVFNRTCQPHFHLLHSDGKPYVFSFGWLHPETEEPRLDVLNLSAQIFGSSASWWSPWFPSSWWSSGPTSSSETEWGGTERMKHRIVLLLLISSGQTRGILMIWQILKEHHLHDLLWMASAEPEFLW